MTNALHHIQTSQLICTANQLTGFYMMGNIGRQWVSEMLQFKYLVSEVLMTQKQPPEVFCKKRRS